METVTVAATRGYTLSEMEILVGSAVVLAVLVWTVLSYWSKTQRRSAT